MSRCIAFENPVVNSYAQSSSITSEQEKLIMTSIQPWLHVAVRKSQSGTVWSEIWLRVEYQKGIIHPYISNGYLFVFIWSTVQVLWLFARRRVWWKLQFWTDCSAERKINSGAVRVGFFPWVEYQNVGQLSQLSIDYLYILNGLTVSKIWNFTHRQNCWKLNWTTQHMEETKFWQLSKSETPGLPNTIPLGNSLHFPMVHLMTPNGQRLTSYGYQNMVGLLTWGNMNRLDLSAQIRILVKFCHDLPRNFVYEKCR
jgi:hypothetical protein